MSNNTEEEIINDENCKKENDESLFNLEDDDKKQDINDDNQLKCYLCKQLYNQPKFLSCTHTYCFKCCEKLIKNNTNKDQIQIECPLCQQITEVSNLNMLVDNYLLNHEIENLALKKGSIECRACTSNDIGVAHCSTCSSYLCSKCCQAHQYMKCFEQHHVRRLSQIDNDEHISNNLCKSHDKYDLIYYCRTCSISLCEQCLLLHPTTTHDIEKNRFELIRQDLNDKINHIDQIRSNALAYLDHQLTSLQHDYDKAKTQIDQTHQLYQQVLNDVYKEYLSSLSSLQRDEEMRLIDKLETIQKGSQSFDDSRTVFQDCLLKCSLNELIELKKKLFDQKLNSFQQLFQYDSSNFKINEQLNKDDLVQFISTPIQDFQQLIKLHFGQLIKPQSKQISSPNNQHYQVFLFYHFIHIYTSKSIF
ncbi:unnamed protein product [Rotaria sp. Silwood1]|nr:unnamed protein product [Rotaria sp. Silwood1]